jgi:hypothetical protein
MQKVCQDIHEDLHQKEDKSSHICLQQIFQVEISTDLKRIGDHNVGPRGRSVFRSVMCKLYYVAMDTFGGMTYPPISTVSMDTRFSSGAGEYKLAVTKKK